jgi:Mg-chelatase subunit ChlI
MDERMESITIYRNMVDSVRNLDQTDFQPIVMAIFDFALDGKEPENLTPMQYAVFNMTRVNIEKSNERRRSKAEYEKKRRERKKAEREGLKSNSVDNAWTSVDNESKCVDVRYDKEKEKEKEKVKEKVKENEKEKEKEKVKEKESKNNSNNIYICGEKISPQTPRKNFVKPTVEEVREYCLERKNNVDPERFVNFYESKDWFVGKNKMKDWRAAVRTWERGNTSSGYMNTISNRVDVVDSWLTGGGND